MTGVQTCALPISKFAAARGFVDAILAPEETRDTIAFLLEVTSNSARVRPAGAP